MLRKIKEKIKSVFKHRKESEVTDLKKDKSFNGAIQGASDIARSIRESGKFQTQKKLWRNIFHF
jgi:fructose 1,6-bisphosphatase